MDKKEAGKIAGGVLLGAAAGAAAGILLAPKSGKETRKAIGKKAKEYVAKGKELVENESKSAKKLIKKTVKKINK